MCGEHDVEAGQFKGYVGSSPHVRGALIRFSTKNIGRRDHPRMCGEHPKTAEISLVVSGSSPHVRGARHFGVCGKPRVGIIPACAGSTCRASSPRRCARDHPRMCGEHRAIHDHLSVNEGSSPHVRGAHLQQHRTVVDRGIIPACAGSTCPLSDCIAPQGDHPRMCGEHMSCRLYCQRRWGSSPHVRGARGGGMASVGRSGIIPACAGST